MTSNIIRMPSETAGSEWKTEAIKNNNILMGGKDKWQHIKTVFQKIKFNKAKKK